MTRFALPIIMAVAVTTSALAQNADAPSPAVTVTVTCDDLTATARAARPECRQTAIIQRRAAKLHPVPLFRPFQLADRSDRPMQRKILRLPWVIGVYQ